MGALDEILATIRRLPLPERLRLIERATLERADDTPKPVAVSERASTLSVDDFLAARLTPPPSVGPVNLQDMARDDEAQCRLAERLLELPHFPCCF